MKVREIAILSLSALAQVSLRVIEYFDAVSRQFEMKERIDAINQKIDYASEVQSTLRALLTEVCGCMLHQIP